MTVDLPNLRMFFLFFQIIRMLVCQVGYSIIKQIWINSYVSQSKVDLEWICNVYIWSFIKKRSLFQVYITIIKIIKIIKIINLTKYLLESVKISLLLPGPWMLCNPRCSSSWNTSPSTLRSLQLSGTPKGRPARWKPSENSMGKRLENGEMIGKPWENQGKMMNNTSVKRT